MMKNPSHPGPFILDMCMQPNGLNLAQTAKKLGITKKRLDDFINCRIGVKVDLAIKLAKAFGSTPDLWCRMQHQHDLAKELRQIKKIKAKQNKTPSKKPASRKAMKLRQTTRKTQAIKKNKPHSH